MWPLRTPIAILTCVQVVLLPSLIQAQNEDPNLSVLESPVELERLVLNVYNSRNWLLVFHQEQCNKCVYESIKVMALAKWLSGLNLDPMLQIGLVTCSRNPDEWKQSPDYQTLCSPTSDEMVLVKPQSQSVATDGIVLPNSLWKRLPALQNAIGSHLGGNWTALAEDELL
eukprot:maker-scaffold87_size395581-snap-gene-1.11 protein:Tk12238 transcript:maker-scaffold87_size395581-snap-gene-1.11-mRNA-1 annotation:"transcriptional regulator -like 6"